MVLDVLKEVESKIKDYWRVIDLRNTVLEENKKRKKKFWLLDGPPYPNDLPHVGHARNIVTKDFFLKYYFLNGYAIYFRPGFDTHGLPIEVKVEKKLNIKSKRDIEEKVGVDKFIEECKKFALGNEAKWMEFYEKIGHFYAFTDKPYLTLSKDYIETAWYIFKKIWERGLVYEEEKPVWWCPRCQTTLAGYEVVDEYTDLEDPSIYVLFPLKDEENTYLLVWTTTPWTLNANVAIAVHPEEYYVKVELEDGKKIILAEKRLELLDKWKVKYKVVERFKGKELEGKKYLRVIDNELQRKLDEEAHIVVLSIPILKGYVGAKILAKKEIEEQKAEYEHFVNVEEGTGLVHLATGHGKEDYLVGKHYNLPVYSVVDDEGKLTVEPFKGKFFRDANEDVIKYLEEKGLLFWKEKIVHRYPLCWRCKTPLVIRTHKDLFINIQKVKGDMLKAVKEKIVFNPEFARERMVNWVKNEEDWDISRQRYWGIPIPVWKCEKCGHIEVIGSIRELKEKAINLEGEINDLHRNIVDKIYLRCPKCGNAMSRVKDVFDVWFDSGVATFASLHYPFENKDLFKRIWRVDIVMEGQDQIRGWFDRLLDVSMTSIGDHPFDRILMFGWVVDEKGQKMSKRLGNVIWAFDAYNLLGADILRFYTLWKASPWETISFSLSEAKKEVSRIFNIFLNVTRYIIERGREVGEEIKELKYEDKWLLYKFNELIKELKNIVEKTGEINKYVRKLEEFGVNIISRIYIKLVRDRVQIEKDSTPIGVLVDIWKNFLILLAPVSPFLSEYLYQKLGEEFGLAKKTIFLDEYPRVNEEYLKFNDIDKEMKIILELQDYIANVRSKLGIKQRYPLKYVVLNENIEKEVKNKEEFINLLKRFLNVEEVMFKGEVENYEEVETRFGVIKVSKEYDFEKAFVSEFSRLIQERRKKLGYKVYEKLELLINTKDENIKEILEKNKNFIEKRTNTKITFTNEKLKMYIEVLGKKVDIELREKKKLFEKLKRIIGKIFKL